MSDRVHPAMRVFISYSRKDGDVAQALRTALNEAGFDAYLDLHDIAPGEDWRARLGALIAAAEKMVFLISPDSVASEICDWEVNEAERQGKSLLPVVVRDTDRRDIPGRLERLNFIFFRDAVERAAGVEMLTAALATDLEWEREKTRVNELAATWDGSGRPQRLLTWRGDAIRALEKWRDSYPPTARPPTEAHLAYIAESRKRFTRRQHQMRAALGAVALVSSAAAIAAVWFGLEAAERQAEAVARRDEALATESRMLARAAQSALERGAVSKSITLARLALPWDPTVAADRLDRPLVADAVQALYNAVPRSREVAVMRGHGGAVLGVQPLPQGRILTWSVDATARIWTEAGEELIRLSGHEGPVRGARRLPDGRFLTWGDVDARIWSPQGDQLIVMRPPNNAVSGAMVMKNGEVFIWGPIMGDDIYFASQGSYWNARGEKIRDSYDVVGAVVLRDGRPAIWTNYDVNWDVTVEDGPSLHWRANSMDGIELLDSGSFVTWGGPTARLWSPTGKARGALEGHETDVRGAASLGADRILTWSEDATARIWTNDGAQIAVLRNHDGPVLGGRPLADGRVLTWGADATARLWSDEGQALAILQGHADAVIGADELDDGRILTWSRDGVLRTWRSDGSALDTLGAHDAAVAGAHALADGRVVSWGADGAVRIWSMRGADLVRYASHDSEITGAEELPGGRFLTWGKNKAAHIWRADGSTEAMLAGHEAGVTDAFAPGDGRIITLGQHGLALLFDPAGAQLRRLKPAGEYVRGVARLSDGRILTWSAESARLLSARGAPLAELRRGDRRLFTAFVLADGRIVIAKSDSSVDVWSDQGAFLAELRGHRFFVEGAQSLDGGRVLTWALDAARIWDSDGRLQVTFETEGESVHGATELRDGKIFTWGAIRTEDARGFGFVGRLWTAMGGLERVLRGHDGSVLGVHLVENGDFLTYGVDGTVRRWSTDGEERAVLRGHEGAVLGIRTLRDGDLLTRGRDGAARLWDAGGRLRATLPGHVRAVNGAAELANGRILTWGEDGAAQMWPSDITDLIGWADRTVADLQPLTVQDQCAVFQLSEDVCALAGDDAFAVDAVETLLRKGGRWLEARDRRADAALSLARALPLDPRYERLMRWLKPQATARSVSDRAAEIDTRIAQMRASDGE